MVSVENGTKIASIATCKQLKWSMQGKEFKADMRLIPLGVGGWLKNDVRNTMVSPIRANFMGLRKFVNGIWLEWEKNIIT